MMPIFSEYDKRMIEKTKDWMYLDKDGRFHLREDAPDDVKKHCKRMEKLYEN
ncbi:MAG: hypothetical protein ACI4EV_02090 [Lachnospiraceae bacterium]